MIPHASVSLALALSLAIPPAAAAPDERAYTRFEAGERAFAEGRFLEAAAAFADAFALDPEPAYLFNHGLALHRAERFAAAVRAFETLLTRFPDSPRRAEVEARLADARSARTMREATVILRSTPPGARADLVVPSGEPALGCVTPCMLRVDPGDHDFVVQLGDARRHFGRSLAPSATVELEADLRTGPEPDHTPSWVAFGVGGAALVTGVIFGALAQDAHDRGLALAEGPPLSSAGAARLAGLREDVRDHSLVADLGFGLALTGAVVGLVTWLAAEPPSPPEPPVTSRL